MSEGVACALEVLDKDGTRETRVFIRNINKFFDCLNSRSTVMAKLKRNDSVDAFYKSSDERFQV